MSSSPKAAPAPPAARTETLPLREPPEVLPFSYCDVGGTASRGNLGGILGNHAALPGREELATDGSLLAQARESGRQAGEREARAKFELELARERAGLAQALADFSGERAAYYQKIEEESVQLALSIARKVLHREAQVDPLLLMGVVRVALERMEGATGVVLTVHPQQAAEWRRYLSSCLEAGALPEIAEDAALGLGQCGLRTSMGTAELGVEVQLKEIEQGLMDLLAARPQEKAKP